MEKFKFIIAVLLLMLTFNGCSDYLDVVPDNTATLEMAFHDRYNAEKFLFTCYSFIPSHGSENADPGIMAGDEVWVNEYVNRDGLRIAKGEQNANYPLNNYWTGERSGKRLFVGIRNCNIFIDNIDNVGDLPAQEKIRWKAEAKFIKAYLHWYLLRMYGPIPIMDENKSINSPAEEFMGKRAPIDECFKYVLDLLSEVAEELPMKISNPSSELGRITKPIALALKARVAVTYASPLFNGNSDFTSLEDKEGNKLFDNTYDPEKWGSAAAACKEAIDVCQEADHRLFQKEDFNITRGTFSDTSKQIIILRQAVSLWGDDNPETIWGNTSSPITGGYQNHACPVYREHTGIYPTNQFLNATLRMAELFYTNNGVPIEEDVDYDYDNRYELATATQADALFLAPMETTAKLHFNREYRFYSSLAFDRGAWVGNGSDDEAPWYVRARVGEPAYKLGERYMYGITGYWPKKMIHLESEINANGWFSAKSYAFPVIRMSGLYLMYAEALNESDNIAEAQSWVDKVRARAGLNGVVESWANHSSSPSKPTSKDGLREIIQRERLIELAFEGERFWDLRRWKRSEEFMNQPIRGWNTLSTGDANDYYTLNTYFVQEFNVRDYLWPIKEDDLLKNTNLVQNPGWK